MTRAPLLAALGVVAVGACVYLLQGPPALTFEPELALDAAAMFDRPTTLTVRATERCGEAVAPWPLAELTVEQRIGAPSTRTLMTDVEGCLQLDLAEAWAQAGRPAGPIEVVLVLRSEEGREARLAYATDAATLQARIEGTARRAEAAEAVQAWSRARAAWGDLLRLDPSRASAAWLGLARAHESLGEPEQALIALREGLVLDPELDDGREARHRELRARAVRLAAALPPGRALPPTPAAVRALEEAGRRSSLDEALAFALAAQDAAPWWPAAYVQAGYYRLKRWEAAPERGFDTWDLDQAEALGGEDAARARALRDEPARLRARRAEARARLEAERAAELRRREAQYQRDMADVLDEVRRVVEGR